MSRTRQRRTIDMLPLLDVFMVVLFVFATIQEQQLDTSTQELERLRASVREQQARLAQLDQGQQRDPVELELDRAREREREAARAKLEERVAAYEAACGPALPEGPICPTAQVPVRTIAEQQEIDRLLDRLFDNVAVFEIELEGEPDLTANQLRNHCCYRPDPPKGEWKSCGEVPSDSEARAAWLDDGAQGLLEALQRTRGGQAIVLVRQGAQARYRLTNDLSEQLRDRLPDHRVYDDGGMVGPPTCPLLPH